MSVDCCFASPEAELKYKEKEKELSRFDTKKMTQNQKMVMGMVKDEFKELANKIINGLPDCKDKDACILYLRLASMLAVASIAHDWPISPELEEPAKESAAQ